MTYTAPTAGTGVTGQPEAHHLNTLTKGTHMTHPSPSFLALPAPAQEVRLNHLFSMLDHHGAMGNLSTGPAGSDHRRAYHEYAAIIARETGFDPRPTI